MKKLILLVIVLVVTGCYETPKEVLNKEAWKTIVIDSCEYITRESFSGYSGVGFLAHKGNCKFCKERNKK